MALPQIAVPKYKLKLPSTGKTITFRPFLVKEEKILLAAVQTDDSETAILDAVVNIVNSCIETKGVDANDLPSFDLEYIFLNLRARSVGEEVQLSVNCKVGDCGMKFDDSVNLLDIKVNRDKNHDRKIVFSEDIGVTMRYPNLRDAQEMDSAGTDSDRVFKLIAKCIERIFTKESVYDRAEHSDEEFEEFIEGLSPEFFAKLTDFFTTIPNMNNTLEFTCPKCQKKTKVEVSNIEDFFT